MNPEIEIFLQEAFRSLQPGMLGAAVQGVGRVLVEPDYESAVALENAEQLTSELRKLLSSQKLDLLALQSHTGFEIDDLDKYPNLRKLVLRVTLHADAADGPWVEVAPPGNWI